MIRTNRFSKKVVKALCEGKIMVIPTDTLYGIVGKASIPKTIEKIYSLRGRNKKKPMIILISSLSSLAHFGVVPSAQEKSFLKNYWPGSVSVVFSCRKKELAYLHRGKKSLAFRVPKEKALRNLLIKTGPLVAPSANKEGMSPAKTTKEAYRYFGDTIAGYVDKGVKRGEPSTVVSFSLEKPFVLRQGKVKIILP